MQFKVQFPTLIACVDLVKVPLSLHMLRRLKGIQPIYVARKIQNLQVIRQL